MTARRAQAVKSAAGEVVAVEDAKGAVQLLGLLAVAAHEAGGANAEATRRAGLPACVIAAAPTGRAAPCLRAQLQPPSPGGDSTSASAPLPQ